MIIANGLSPPVQIKPVVMLYHRRFQIDPAMMHTHHRQIMLRTGGDKFLGITVGL